jgi:hypothetical protein
MTTAENTAPAEVHPTRFAANATGFLELLARLKRASHKLDLAVEAFGPPDFKEVTSEDLGKVYLTQDIAGELDDLCCAFDDWSTESGLIPTAREGLDRRNIALIDGLSRRMLQSEEPQPGDDD